MKEYQKILMVTLFSLVALLGCGNKKEAKIINVPNSQNEKKFEDGQYTYNSRFLKGTEPCANDDGTCLSLNDYKDMCENIDSVTKGMGAHLLNFTNQRFSKLYAGGNIEDISGKWIGKESWSSDSGINGACQVTIRVSGMLDGTSAREEYEGYAKEFIISEGKILVHRFSAGSAYML